MAFRVTHDEVNDIFETSTDTTPFIRTANLLVSEQLVGKGLSDARLREIELWLSAHYAAVSLEKGGLRTKVIGDARETYALQTGAGLGMTRYGQQAVAMDTTGLLRTLDKAKARFTVL